MKNYYTSKQKKVLMYTVNIKIYIFTQNIILFCNQVKMVKIFRQSIIFLV